MQKVKSKQAIEQAYKNLYTCNLKDIDKNLNKLIDAKKFQAIQNAKNNRKK